VLKLNDELTSPKLAARVGIDSGAVVVGAGADKDAEVFGETPNIAARLQANRDSRHGADNRRHAPPDLGTIRDPSNRD
jgi:class 3 adenylate cyclase